jgi:hypothetical protein
MEVYRMTIKRRMLFCRILVLIFMILTIAFQFGLFGFGELSSTNGEIIDFQRGLLVAFMIFPLVFSIKYHNALKDETKLKKLHNEENDERQKFIRQKSGMPVMMITSGLMILAGIVIGYINKIVFFTLIIAAMGQMTLGALIKIYYMKKL